MKNKTLAYILIFLVAFAAAIIIVSLTQKNKSDNSYANTVLPEDLLFMMTTNSIENLAGEIKSKADFLGSKDATPYNSIMASLGVPVSEPIRNSDELKAMLGVCPLSPAGYVILDPTPAATMQYFCLNNKAIFLDYLKKNYDLSEQSIEGLDYFKITSKTPSVCCQFVYIINDTAFLFSNEYYLKNIFKEESKKISDNKLYAQFKQENKDASAFIYINSKKIGEYLANILAFAKPSISQQINLMIKDKELASKSQVFGEALGGLFDILIKFLKSQDSIYTALVFEKEGLKIESNIRMLLAEKTKEVFAKPPQENKLIEYLPDGALMVSQDNFSDEFCIWKNEAIKGSFKDLLKKLKPNETPAESNPDDLEHQVFAMYPGYSSDAPYLQLNLNNEDTVKYDFLKKESDLKDTNIFFESIEFLLPMKMRFVPDNIRTFNNIKIKKFYLNFLPNEKSIVMQILKEMEPDRQIGSMIRGNYSFELTGHKNIAIFVGDDKNGKFMNDFLSLLDGKKTLKKLIGTDSYNFIKSKTYPDSSSSIYISVAQYLFQSVYYMNDFPLKEAEKLKIGLKNKNINYHAISIKMHENGIYSRIYVNFNDLKQVFNLFNTLNAMESAKAN